MIYYCFLVFFCCISTSFAQMQDPIGIKTDDGNTVYGFQFNFTGSSGIETQSTPGGIPNVIFKLATSGPGAAWIQGGNTFGATGVFGTLDNFDINIITNGRTVMTIASSLIDSLINIDADTSVSGANAILKLNSGSSGNSKLEVWVNDVIQTSAFGYDPIINGTVIDYGPSPNVLYFRNITGTVLAQLTSTGDLFLSGVGTSTLSPLKFYMNTIERMRIDTDGRVTKNNHGVAEMQTFAAIASQTVFSFCPSWSPAYAINGITTTSPLTSVFMGQVRISNTSGSTRTYRLSIQRTFLGSCTGVLIGGANAYWQSVNVANNQTVTATFFTSEPSISGTANYAICACTVQSPPSGTVENQRLTIWEF